MFNDGNNFDDRNDVALRSADLRRDVDTMRRRLRHTRAGAGGDRTFTQLPRWDTTWPVDLTGVPPGIYANVLWLRSWFVEICGTVVVSDPKLLAVTALAEGDAPTGTAVHVAALLSVSEYTQRVTVHRGHHVGHHDGRWSELTTGGPWGDLDQLVLEHARRCAKLDDLVAAVHTEADTWAFMDADHRLQRFAAFHGVHMSKKLVAKTLSTATEVNTKQLARSLSADVDPKTAMRVANAFAFVAHAI